MLWWIFPQPYPRDMTAAVVHLERTDSSVRAISRRVRLLVWPRRRRGCRGASPRWRSGFLLLDMLRVGGLPMRRGRQIGTMRLLYQTPVQNSMLKAGAQRPTPSMAVRQAPCHRFGAILNGRR
jgi:hypothetical protein